MTFWTSDRVADALQPLATVNLPRGPQWFRRVWTDTRTIGQGDLFVALVGERFDAHEFLRQAVESGATGLVVSRVEPARGLGVPVYEVSDTLVAFGALGRYRRRAWGKPVVGVVGTNGKTSTKELLKAALGSTLATHATYGNLNNLVGVPLTLLAIPDDADVAVIEMGTNQPGEVARLRSVVDPDVTVVTSIAEEHLEGLGDLAGVMREELAACDGIATAVVPASQPDVVNEASKRARRVIAAGLDDGDFRADRWTLRTDGSGQATVAAVDIHVPLRGVHNLRNTMLALAVARELGVPLDRAGHGIAAMPLPPMRSNVVQVGRATLVNDAYNSNPGSARAALELLQHAGHGRQRVAVLGTMLELGPSGPALHEALARDALASPIELLAGLGEFALAFDRAADGSARNRLVTAHDVDSLWNRLSSRLEPDAVILLKASRGVRLEQLIPKIKEWATSTSNT
ncbi:MAG TPA: UDP-N-acetylmuramoyl-tripeptide--D-alanyl-D-alanine ligase [Gemmatimonadaceae bacterium]|nr:UDP-N-acetylmuramoyl-tripeptide--D-alanyl-D-alanine ligase [Gemmatimonadaceae bacterium]